ncbi:MAG: ferrous iron transport protein A [Saprospiraceae bacterium]|nr:ferrous iron transport protein A [Saprospiraceae bacterium]
MINNMVAPPQSGTVLSILKTGIIGIIAEYTDPYVGGKLVSMGILPGSEVEIVRRSLFGSSIYARIDDSLVALRKEEAACIVLR